MTNADFKTRSQNAIQEMQEMNKKSKPPNPKTEPVSKNPKNSQSSLLGGFNIPFLDNLKTDGDLTLIIGLLLLLLSEKADKRLLFALIYILL